MTNRATFKKSVKIRVSCQTPSGLQNNVEWNLLIPTKAQRQPSRWPGFREMHFFVERRTIRPNLSSGSLMMDTARNFPHTNMVAESVVA